MTEQEQEEQGGEQIECAGAITADGPIPSPGTPEGWGITWV